MKKVKMGKGKKKKRRKKQLIKIETMGGKSHSHGNLHAVVRLFCPLCLSRTFTGLQLCSPVESVRD